MASEGPNDPATQVSDNSIGNIAWILSNTVFSADSAGPQATLDGASGDVSEYLKITNFPFSVPSGATIDGIKMESKRNRASGIGTIEDLSISIVKGGSIIGNEKAVSGAWPSSFAYAVYGGSSDLWGLSWTDSDINASNFGTAIAAIETGGTDTATAHIDHVRITVYYTPAVTVGEIMAAIGQQECQVRELRPIAVPYCLSRIRKGDRKWKRSLPRRRVLPVVLTRL